jgi:hypothetical protein
LTRPAASPKAAITSAIWAGVASVGVRPNCGLGTTDGAIGTTSGARLWLPACCSWQKIFAPSAWTASVSRCRRGMWSSSWTPVIPAIDFPLGWT